MDYVQNSKQSFLCEIVLNLHIAHQGDTPRNQRPTDEEALHFLNELNVLSLVLSLFHFPAASFHFYSESLVPCFVSKQKLILTQAICLDS